MNYLHMVANEKRPKILGDMSIQERLDAFMHDFEPEHNTQEIGCSDPHPATIGQKQTQKDKLLELLRDMDAVPVQLIVSLGITQYNARIYELNKELAINGEVIESVTINGEACKRLERV